MTPVELRTHVEDSIAKNGLLATFTLIAGNSPPVLKYCAAGSRDHIDAAAARVLKSHWVPITRKAHHQAPFCPAWVFQRFARTGVPAADDLVASVAQQFAVSGDVPDGFFLFRNDDASVRFFVGGNEGRVITVFADATRAEIAAKTRKPWDEVEPILDRLLATAVAQGWDVTTQRKTLPQPAGG